MKTQNFTNKTRYDSKLFPFAIMFLLFNKISSNESYSVAHTTCNINIYDGIITQNIFNAAISTSVELKTNTNRYSFVNI